MERKRKFTVLFVSLLLLTTAIFEKKIDDMTGRLTMIIIAYSMLSLLIEDKTLNKILRISSVVIFAMIWILGKGFNYFKI
jgi:hypothetical protein